MRIDFRRISKRLLPILIFTILAIISLRGVIDKSGMIGHTWDWNIPPYPENFITGFIRYFSSWNDIINLGYPQMASMDLYYWIIITPLGLLGGEIMSKAVLTLFMILSAFSMFLLCKQLGCKGYISVISGIYYMFSPPIYTRIVAGHLPLLFGISILPLLPLFLIKCFDKNQKTGFRLSGIIIAGIIFSLVSEHPSMIVLAFIILLLVCLVELAHVPKLHVFGAFVGTLGVFFLLNMYWIYPYLMSSLEKTQFAFAGGTVGINPQELISNRVDLLEKYSQPVLNSIRVISSPQVHMGMEYAFPTYNAPEPLYTLVTFLLPIFAFLTLLSKPSRNKLIFVLIALLGIVLVSGVTTPLGQFIYMKILFLLPPVFAEFAETPNRFLPLVTLSYAVLLGYFFENVDRHIYTYLSRLRFVTKVKKSTFFTARQLKRLVVIIIIVSFLTPVIFFSWPFINGNMSRQVPGTGADQPMCLLVNDINSEDAKVIEFLKNETGDFRVTYLPPASWSYVGITNHTFEFTTIYSVKSEFMGSIYQNTPSFSRFVLFTLIDKRPYELKSVPYTNLGKIFGLANVKYIVFPHYDSISVYYVGERQQVLERTIKSQSDITKLSEPNLSTIDIYENNDFLNHIYPVNNISLISGDLGSLISLSNIPEFEFNKTGLIFSNQITNSDFIQLNQLSSNVIFYDNDIFDMILPLLEPYIIYPGLQVVNLNPYNDWANLRYSMYTMSNARLVYLGVLQLGNGIFTLNPNTIDINFSVSTEGVHDIYAKVLLGPGSKLNFSIDGREIGEIVTKGNSDPHFSWVHINSEYIGEGTHTLRVRSDAGENAIMGIIITPENLMSTMLEDVLVNKKIILLNEMKQFKQEELMGVPTPVSGILDVPKENDYNLMLQAYQTKAPNINVKINGESYNLSLAYKTKPEQGNNSFISLETGKPEHDIYISGKKWVGQSFIANAKTIEMYLDFAKTTTKPLNGNILIELYGDNNSSPSGDCLASFTINDADVLSTYKSFDIKFPYSFTEEEKYWIVLKDSDPTDLAEGFVTHGTGIDYPMIEHKYTVDYINWIKDPANAEVSFKIQSAPALQWYWFEKNIHLQKGFNEFTISGSDLYLKLLVASSPNSKNSNQTEFIQTEKSPGSIFSVGNQIPQVTSVKISPTKYEIHVNSSSPFFLFFSENFNPKWKAYIGNDILGGPYQSYGFANLFYIDKLGSFTILLQYDEQGIFNMGIFITFSSWALFVSCVLIDQIRLRKIKLIDKATFTTR